jgi:hypothetical protein
MARVRILQGIAGVDFSWAPGDIVELDDDQAAKWADGYRSELVDPPAPEPTRPARRADDAAAGTEKAAARSRGGGRGRRAETR